MIIPGAVRRYRVRGADCELSSAVVTGHMTPRCMPGQLPPENYYRGYLPYSWG